MNSTHYVNRMYTMTYLRATCVTECFITNYWDMDAPQHAQIDVLADVTVA